VEDTVARGQQPKIADPAPYPLTVSLPLTRPFPGATWHQEISVTDENCAQYAEQTKKIKTSAMLSSAERTISPAACVAV